MGNEENKEWTVEFWDFDCCGRDHGQVGRWVCASGWHDFVDTFEEAAKEAYWREKLATFTYRLRNTRTGAIIPAAIL